MTTRSIITYISSSFIILLALLTIIFETTEDKELDKVQPMFPYMPQISHKINRIDINYPNTSVTLYRNEYNQWLLPLSDNFPANTYIINRLLENIKNMQLIAHKTEKHENFARLNLLNPDLEKKLGGEGIRFTLYMDNKRPHIDFIVGDQLKSFVSQTNSRFFTRFASVGRAFLAQTNSNFDYKPEDFLTNEFGMPQLNEIIGVKLTKDKNTLLNIKRLTDNNSKEFNFIPTKIPEGKKLIYPSVMHDYMVALTQQLRPMGAMLLPQEKPIPDATITFELTKGRLAKIHFWKVKDMYFMRIIRDDIEAPHIYYVYNIQKKDYEALIQPLKKFLI